MASWDGIAGDGEWDSVFFCVACWGFGADGCGDASTRWRVVWHGWRGERGLCHAV